MKTFGKFYEYSFADEYSAFCYIVEVIDSGLNEKKVLSFFFDALGEMQTFNFRMEYLSYEEIQIRLKDDYSLGRFDTLAMMIESWKNDLYQSLLRIEKLALNSSLRFFASDSTFAMLSERENFQVYFGANEWTIENGSFSSLVPSNKPIKLNMFGDLFFSFQEIFSEKDTDKILKNPNMKEINGNIRFSGAYKMNDLIYEYLREMADRIKFFNSNV